MTRRIAIKKLTASDLTFFEWQFRNHNAGNQKAINLNADVFVDVLYPSLPAAAAKTDGRVPLDLTIYGPGLAGPYNLQRKIIKLGAYKNWRLDGEFIHDPEDEPGRFNVLVPDDLVVLDFIGDIVPSSATAVFVAKGLPEDERLHAVLVKFLGERSMAPVTATELANLLEGVDVAEEHPIKELILDAALEDAAQGGIRGTRTLLSRPAGRTMSRSSLQRAREQADEVGREGEGYVNARLSALRKARKIKSFEWVSDTNAVSPYDFRVNLDGKLWGLIDVKSTRGEFDRVLHISLSELRQMACGEEEYEIYRVYEIEEGAAKLRTAKNLKGFAKSILGVMGKLPKGVVPDGVSVEPSSLRFGPEVVVSLPEEPEG